MDVGRVREGWRGEFGDRVLAVAGWAIALSAWARDRKVSQRLADLEVPHAIKLPVLLFIRIRQRRTDRASAELSKSLAELGSVLGARMRENDERDERVLRLTESMESLNRRLVRLTVVLGAIGVASIAATVWSALR